MKLYAGKAIRTCSRERCARVSDPFRTLQAPLSGSKALNIGEELLCALPARFRPQRFH